MLHELPASLARPCTALPRLPALPVATLPPVTALPVHGKYLAQRA